MTVKRYGYPIVKFGGQDIGDLLKFYQKNQCIEDAIAKFNASKSNALKLR